MGASIEEKNDKVAWKAYMEEGEILKAEVLRRREAVEKKYKNSPHPKGLDTDPAEKELGEVTHWFSQEVKRLQEKYGIRT